MNPISALRSQLFHLGMLRHPFYNLLWNNGKLGTEDIAHYSEQYYSIEKVFLECLRNMLNMPEASNGDTRVVIMGNLNDELGHGVRENSHLNLWLKMVEFFGSNAEKIDGVALNPETQGLVDTFRELSKKSMPAAIGALYSYEHQIPDVSESKIKTLCEFYGTDLDGKELSFFKEHRRADVWHAAQWESLTKNFDLNQFEEFKDAAIEGAKALLSFLDGIMLHRRLQC